ncbi:hypothetical protein L7F22_005593 [Adiantum nelumboides]|nr:hypothetical protein [Adiantum nelumboides]
MVETMTGRRIKILRSDNGGEFLSKEFSQYLLQHGIKRQLTCSYTPQQNGVLERKNRTLFDVARCMLKDKGHSNCYWAEAINTACYLMNQSPTEILKGITPYEALHKVKPKVHQLRVFGCLAFTHVSDEKRKKLDDKSRRCILARYSDVSKAYKLYDSIKKDSFISRNVIFDENASFKSTPNAKDTSSPTPLKIDVPSNIQEEIIEEIDEEDEEHQAALRRSSRTRRQPQQLTYQREAMDKEMDALYYKNGTWNLCPLPHNKKAIGCKWLYKLKFNKEGKVDRYKARLVAKGFAQQHGLDYDETYAPVAKMSSIRLLISLASIFKWKLKQMDVNNAFLNGLLEEEVYMQHPRDMVLQGKKAWNVNSRRVYAG